MGGPIQGQKEEAKVQLYAVQLKDDIKKYAAQSCRVGCRAFWQHRVFY